MPSQYPILVTGAAGKVGAVGRLIVEQLLNKNLPVRAMVHSDDERAAALRANGAEVVTGDLTEPTDVVRVLKGCKRAYFGMSVSAPYLEATVIMAAAARELGGLPDHVMHHIATMAHLHAENRYDRFTDTVEKLTGKPSMSVKEFIANRPELFKQPSLEVSQ